MAAVAWALGHMTAELYVQLSCWIPPARWYEILRRTMRERAVAALICVAT